MATLNRGLVLALLLGASVAHAAGLGKLTVNSALGQPLQAEIDLVSLQPGEEDSLTARVGTPEQFREARIEYVNAVRLLRFAIDKRANGSPFLKVTSIAPINEPFLDVLVEVTWPSGRLQREYPILLDPPGYAQGKVAAPTVSAPSQPQTPPAQPAVSSSTPTPAPAQQAEAPAASPTPPSTPAPSAGSVATGQPSAQAEMGATAGADTYGPVQKGDTLRKIAEGVKPSNVSLEQMLVALYRENKSAFSGNNMNRLKTGQILKVPSAEEVEKIEQKEANREYRTHVSDWKSYRDQLAGGVAAAPAPSESSTSATGRIGSAAVTPPPTTAPSSGDVLKLSKSEAGKAGARAGAASQDRLNALQEELTAKDKALREAQSRVADLEKQIRDMQRLAELKGSAAPSKDSSKVAVAPVPPAASTKPAETPKPAEAAKPAEPPKVAETKPAEPPKPAVVADASKPAETKPAEPPKPAESAKPAEPPKTAAAPPKTPKKVVPPPPPPSMVDDMMDNPLMLGGIGVAILLAGAGVFLFMRRRRAAANEGFDSPSQMTSSFPSDLKDGGNTSKPAAGLVDTGNSSFLTDFDKTGPGTIDTDEVDPVAEAEVYIAYGRDAQAEEILKEAMARDRNRHEIALKLLEIYHARKSATAFETVAKELRSSVGEDSPLWQKAAAMGAQIDPGNPLYGGAAPSGATFTSMAPAAPAPKPDLDFDIDAQSSHASAPAPSSFDLNLDAEKSIPPGQTKSHGLDFDIDTHSKPAFEAPAASEPVKDEKPAFDFDLSGLDMGTPKKSEPAAEKASSMDLADLSLDSPPAGSEGGEGVGTKLELAKAYLEIGDKDGAREILQEVAKEGSSAQRAEAQKLIATL